MKLRTRRKAKPRRRGGDPSRIDPTRTGALRNAFVKELHRRFARLKGAIVKLVVVEDALGLKQRQGLVANAFDPDQPRDEQGRWSEGGGGQKSRDELIADIRSGGQVSDEDLARHYDVAVKYSRYKGQETGFRDRANKVLLRWQGENPSVEEVWSQLRTSAERAGLGHSGDDYVSQGGSRYFRAGKKDAAGNWNDEIKVRVSGHGGTSLVGQINLTTLQEPSEFKRNLKLALSKLTANANAADCGAGSEEAPGFQAGNTCGGRSLGPRTIKPDVSGLYSGPLYRAESGHAAATKERYGAASERWGLYVTHLRSVAASYGGDIKEFTAKKLKVLGSLSPEYLALRRTLPPQVNKDMLKEAAKKAGWDAIYENKTDGLVILQGKSKNLSIVTTNAGPWAFQPDPRKVQLFLAWLKRQFRELLFDDWDGEGEPDDDAYWQRLVEEGFKKGAGRAWEDYIARHPELRTEPLDFYRGTRAQFLKSSFSRPESVDKVKLLAGRTYTDLKNVTEDMSARMTRALVEGLTQGKHPNEIGKEMSKVVDLGETRSKVIARHEIAIAHSEGQLMAFEELGVEELGVAVEFMTSGREKCSQLAKGEDRRGCVCPACEHLEGIVVKTAEAHGMIPVHPGCFCSWTPSGVGEDRSKQKRTQKAVTRAIGKAQEELGVDEDDDDDAWGPAVPISKDRPGPLVNANDFFSRCDRDDKGWCVAEGELGQGMVLPAHQEVVYRNQGFLLEPDEVLVAHYTEGVGKKRDRRLDDKISSIKRDGLKVGTGDSGSVGSVGSTDLWLWKTPQKVMQNVKSTGQAVVLFAVKKADLAGLEGNADYVKQSVPPNKILAITKTKPPTANSLDAILNFDPDQPRDEQGRWSESGGGVPKGQAIAYLRQAATGDVHEGRSAILERRAGMLYRGIGFKTEEDAIAFLEEGDLSGRGVYGKTTFLSPDPDYASTYMSGAVGVVVEIDPLGLELKQSRSDTVTTTGKIDLRNARRIAIVKAQPDSSLFGAYTKAVIDVSQPTANTAEEREYALLMRLAVNEAQAREYDRLMEQALAVRNAFCPTGPGGGIDPTCSPSSATYRGKLMRMVKSSNGSVRAKASFKKTVRNMPAGAAQHVVDNLKKVTFVDEEAMVRAWNRVTHSSVDVQNSPLGFYDQSKGRIYVRKGEGIGKTGELPLERDDMRKVVGTLQHEMGHALDRGIVRAMKEHRDSLYRRYIRDRNDEKFREGMKRYEDIYRLPPSSYGTPGEFSQTGSWHEAWSEDIVTAKQIGNYASASPSEGFAEFHRLVCHYRDTEGRAGMKKVEKLFPKCARIWKEFGIWD